MPLVLVKLLIISNATWKTQNSQLVENPATWDIPPKEKRLKNIGPNGHVALQFLAFPHSLVCVT